MLTKKSRIIITALSSILCFLSAVYVSCTKPGPSPSCNGVVCKNDGYCNHGSCVCPVGFEGADCGTAVITKYIGAWDVNETVIGSDSVGAVGKQKKYIMFLKNTATPTTFFIDNFLNNPSYNELLCTLDSANSSRFVLDSIRDHNMIFGIFYIRPNSYGNYDATTRKIKANFVIRKLTPTHIWQIDTLLLDMKPHQF